MSNELRENTRQMKEILRELNAFSNQFISINNLDAVNVNKKEKNLLEETLISLTNQLKILNKAFPDLIEKIGIYRGLSSPTEPKKVTQELTKIKLKSPEEEITIVISEKDKSEFLENLNRSRLSIQELKKKYTVRSVSGFRKPNFYAKLSNKLFINFSRSIVDEGYFRRLNKNLRKINSRYILATYISIMLFTILLTFIASLILLATLSFFELSLLYPFMTFSDDPFFIRFIKFFWIILVFPLVSGLLLYFVPANEAKNLGKRIDQELPFITIHMSAIASSGIDPVSIFKIILKREDYKYTNTELKKLMNLINFYGESIVSALKKVSLSSPSSKLRELLNGLAVSITSGGDLHQFLDTHSESMLFNYKLEREKYNKISETFMDVYISVAIAAPMILLLVFVIIGSTGMIDNFFNLSIDTLNFVMILIIILINIFFLIFLKLKQPTF